MRILLGLDKRVGAGYREWRAEEPLHRATLVGIIALAVILRLAVLNQPIRYDEGWMFLNLASRPLGTVLSDYSYPNNHVFHTLLVWLSTRALGNAPWVIRLPTLVAGILLVPAIYLAARQLAGREAGLLASALASALPALILYSTNARGHIVICLASVVLLLLANALAGEDSIELWILFALVSAMGAYTTPTMLYPAGGIGLWVLVERLRLHGVRAAGSTLGRCVVVLGLAVAVALIAYSPVIIRFGIAPLISNRFVTPLPGNEFILALPASAREVRGLLGLGISRILLGVFALVSLLSIAAAGPDRQRRTTLAISMLCWCVFVLVVTKRPPPARVWLFLAPLACIYVGAGLAVAARALSSGSVPREAALSRVGALLLVAAMGIHALRDRVILNSEETDYYGLREAPQVARFLLPRLRAGDRVVSFTTTGLPLDFYFMTLGGRRLAEFDSSSGALQGRVFVIVNERHGQTLESVEGRRRDVAWDALSTPVLSWRLDGTRVYESSSREARE